MSLTLPALFHGGSVALSTGMYPLTRATSFATQVITFQNGYEQRWMDRNPLGQFGLTYNQTHPTDRSNLDAFVLSANSSASPWTLPINAGSGQNFSFPNVFFEEDSITWTENETLPGYFDGTIKCGQHGSGGLPSGVGQGVAFPKLGVAFPGGPGYVTGFPFIRTTSYVVSRVDMDSGNRFAKALLNDAGSSGFPSQSLPDYPTRGLYSWTLTLSTLDNADLGTLEAHFIANGGRYYSFTFTDPNDARTYQTVRYDMDSFQIQYVGFGLASVNVKLAEIYNSSWVA